MTGGNIVSQNSALGTAVISFLGLTGGVVTVTYDNQLMGCEYQFSHYVQNCCTEGELPALFVNDVSSNLMSLSGAQQNGNTVTLTGANYSIWFNGIFTLDTDLELINCPNLLFGPGARFIVPPGFKLTIDNSVLRAGCNVMWKGIEVDGPSGMIIITSSSLPSVSRIEDAQYGIRVFERGNYQIKAGTAFDKNYIGMQVNGPLFQQRFIKESVFQCSANLLPPYPGQTPTPCSRTYAGIELVDVVRSITIGDPTYITDPMLFNQINIGILSRRSSANIYNCEFTNIRTPGDNVCFNALNTPYRGSGIVQLGVIDRFPQILRQRGFGNSDVSDLSFDNCVFGVYAVNSTVDVRQNHMDRMNTGVFTELSLNALQNTVLQNRIHANNWGVRMLNPAGAEVIVYHNDIFVNNTLGGGQGNRRAGVLIEATSPIFDPVQVSVRENHIEVDNARMGIVFENVRNTDALVNDIEVTGTGTNKHGIWPLNLNNHRSGCNTITQTGAFDNVGINARAVPNAIIGCNHTFDFNRGVQLAGQSGNLQLLGNEMNSGNVGLFLSGGPLTVLGPQINRGNQWNGTFNVNGARLQNNVLAAPNRFFVELPIQLSLWPPNPNPPFGWFVPSGCTNCTFDCDDTPQWVCADEQYIYEKTTVTLLDTMIVNGDSLSGEYVEESIRQARRNLYEDLLTNDTLLEANELIEGFFISHSDSVYAQFAQIRFMLNSIMAKNQTLYNAAIIYSTERDSIMQLLLVNDSIFWSGISGNDSLDLLDESENFRNMIYEIDLLLEPVLEELKDSIDLSVLMASQWNETLESASGFQSEVNEYQVNKISFNL